MARYGFIPLLVVFGCLVLGCESEQAPKQPCDGSEAAFALTITAGSHALPADTVVRVQYGGGEEEYQLARPPLNNQVLFCRVAMRDGGAAAADAGTPLVNVDALHCDLWTEGSAKLSVQADMYPEVDLDLEAKIDACGEVQTREVLVDIVPDGGS